MLLREVLICFIFQIDRFTGISDVSAKFEIKHVHNLWEAAQNYLEKIGCSNTELLKYIWLSIDDIDLSEGLLLNTHTQGLVGSVFDAQNTINIENPMQNLATKGFLVVLRCQHFPQFRLPVTMIGTNRLTGPVIFSIWSDIVTVFKAANTFIIELIISDAFCGHVYSAAALAATFNINHTTDLAHDLKRSWRQCIDTPERAPRFTPDGPASRGPIVFLPPLYQGTPIGVFSYKQQ